MNCCFTGRHADCPRERVQDDGEQAPHPGPLALRFSLGKLPPVTGHCHTQLR
jgi:hypothetical protein